MTEKEIFLQLLRRLKEGGSQGFSGAAAEALSETAMCGLDRPATAIPAFRWDGWLVDVRQVPHIDKPGRMSAVPVGPTGTAVESLRGFATLRLSTSAGRTRVSAYFEAEFLPRNGEEAGVYYPRLNAALHQECGEWIAAHNAAVCRRAAERATERAAHQEWLRRR